MFDQIAQSKKDFASSKDAEMIPNLKSIAIEKEISRSRKWIYFYLLFDFLFVSIKYKLILFLWVVLLKNIFIILYSSISIGGT